MKIGGLILDSQDFKTRKDLSYHLCGLEVIGFSDRRTQEPASLKLQFIVEETQT